MTYRLATRAGNQRIVKPGTYTPIVSIAVTPSTFSLAVDETQQLSATVRDSGNNILLGRVINWSSTNPSIATVNAQGLVTAIAAGNASIMASCEGHNTSSAATVSGAGGGGSFPNEPVGATSLFSFDADLGSLPAGIWSLQGGAGNLSTVVDATGPFSPSVVGRVTFPAGCCDGSGPAHFFTGGANVPHNNWSQYYLSWWWKNSANFRGVNNELKQCDIFLGNLTYIIGHQGDQPPWFPHHRQFDINVGKSPTADLQPSTYYQYEVLITRVSGLTLRHRVFINGVLRLDNNWTWDSTSIDQLSFAWIYGGTGSTVPVTMHVDVDHVYSSYVP